MVLLEGMAAEVPIVTTSVGGVPDMLSATDALLVAPNRPDLLAAAIRESIGHPEASRERAKNARKKLDRDYSAATWIERHAALYAEITRR